MSLQLLFNDTIKTIFASEVPKKLAIALSGGVDSFALTHLLAKFVKEERLDTEIYPITINHNLRNISKLELPIIRNELRKIGLQNNFLTTGLNLNNELKNQSFEELARLKRYEAINQLCESKGINHLLLGHHLDDQIETFTLRLLSNSGIFGLSGMQPVTKSSHASHERLNLIRPLLSTPKNRLLNYCIDNKINWVQDHTNFDNINKRNTVRNYLKENPGIKENLFNNFKKVEKFSTEIDGKVNILYGGLFKGRNIDLSRIGNGKIIIKLSNSQLKNNSDLVLSRLFFKLLYPISPSPNYHYSFNKVQDNITKIKSPGSTFSLLQLQWDISPTEDGVLVEVSRQNMKEPIVKEVEVPPNAETDWLLFDNIYWFKFKNPTSEKKLLKIRNLLKDDKSNFQSIPDDFKYSEFKNIPVLIDETDKIVSLPTIRPSKMVEWKIKENIFKF